MGRHIKMKDVYLVQYSVKGVKTLEERYLYPF